MVPVLRIHRSTNQYYVWIDRRRHYLGSDLDQARQRYAQLVANVAAGRPTQAAPDGLTVAEAMLLFIKHASRHAEPRTLGMLHRVAEIVEELHASTPASEFRGKALKQVQQHMIGVKCRKHGNTLSRRYINKLVKVIKACWRWLVAEELVPPETLTSLEAVDGLRAGRGGRELPMIGPVPDNVVEATLPYLTPTLRAMVRFQMTTGCRPGEVCGLRRENLSTSASEVIRMPRTTVDVAAIRVGESLIWLYVPESHKTLWRGKPRAIPVGPQAQEIIAPFLQVEDPSRHLFRPVDSVEEWHQMLRARRKTKVQPSQVERAMRRRRRKQAKPPRDHWRSGEYAAAIRRAITRANKERAEAGLPPLSRWAPNQLRHAAATMITERFDESTASAVLGHSGLAMIQTYVKQAIAKAASAAAKVG